MVFPRTSTVAVKVVLQAYTNNKWDGEKLLTVCALSLFNNKSKIFFIQQFLLLYMQLFTK